MHVKRSLTAIAVTAALALAVFLGSPCPLRAQSPSWLSSSVIYCVNPEIFSTSGLKGVTAQLTRIHNLGCNIIWLMPFQPRGAAVTVDGISHPSFNSPYCINNLEGIASNMGTSSDLTNLVTTAHGLGMKVILDVALNQTSWDNPLVTSNPGYYLHSDGNPNNVASIEDGWGSDTDIAQFNLTTNAYGVQTYVTNVCKYWLQTYNLDGFRFDSADNPFGTSRSLPSSLASSILTALKTINPNVMMLGEEEDLALALNPYDLDYGWNMWFYGVVSAFTTANYESTLQYQWDYPYTIGNTSPATMLRMNIQDDWDVANRDNVTLGGYAQAMAAGVWDFTITGVPLMYNGMEVANNNGGTNSHTQINWSGSNASTFTTFYTQLLALRNNSGGSLQQGTTSFITTSSGAVIAYERTGGGNTYLIEINTNGGTATGTLAAQSGTWTDVTPAGSPGGKSHPLPNTGTFSLKGYDFAVFKSGSTYSGTWQLTPDNNTALRLDVTSNGTANGTTLQAYTSNGTTAQTFVFNNTGVAPAGDYNFVKSGGSYCVQPSGTSSGSSVEIWSCAGTAAQSWAITADSSPSGYYQLKPSSAGSMCLNSTGTASGSAVTIATCNSSTGQQWAAL